MAKYLRVKELPKCNFCEQEGNHGVPARYDAVPRGGTTSWAYMCNDHFDMYTPGNLGTGVGQYLLLPEEEVPDWLITRRR